ncbi:pseudoazurin [Hyphomicrobium sp.]|uniref:pseudoazurin n=1 Tax=Hyphomicrobium sp. TaxID=82 RepID=UPI002E35B9DF|nr:pseudoazurin [Hyphomicrobium sp.]HEX2841226.1 pseudoazurin [Hyphomicrobium sp.]
MPSRLAAIAAIAAVALFAVSPFAGPASAEEHVVKMLNNNGKGKFMLFEPEFIKVNVGDTVKFVPTNKGHNAEMIPGLWPEGAAEFKGDLNEEAVLTIDKPGIYGIKCLPHYPMGMIGMVVAGEPTNKSQLDSYKPVATAEKRYEALKAQAGQ